jgi:NDP-hexose C3-ketoreductase / dTDP-4-oxo-2-deoxy-alpha-D-pentos-2-ene 2,3-reductase
MDYTHLGRSGLSVSRLCLGTMNFGPLLDEAASHRLMDTALEHGLNFFDTANRYGGPASPPGQVARTDAAHVGWTEEIIGNWFAGGGGRRERTVLATKVYGAMEEWPNASGLSALNIRQACDASLRRLRTDHIDLYQMHHVDLTTPWEEIWEAMEVLRRQGKIIYVGSSNHAGWHLAKGQEAANRRGLVGLVSEQSLYNLAERTIELEVLPACRDYGIGVIPWSPLHGGLLGGILRKQDRSRSGGGRATQLLEMHRAAIEAYESFCDELGEQPADVALAWLLHQDGVTAPIIGPRTAEQFTGSLRTLEITLDAGALDRLDKIFPGPGGPAPQAYAW